MTRRRLTLAEKQDWMRERLGGQGTTPTGVNIGPAGSTGVAEWLTIAKSYLMMKSRRGCA